MFAGLFGQVMALSLGAAIVLAASVAPTDPVLRSRWRARR
jgi:NhaP-type Na+/H+ or K+/H+ antiporter